MDTNKLLPLLSEMGTFVKVVELGSFSKAAENLGTAPSSVSRTISRLENTLEISLLQRTTRQMSLTPEGEAVFALCREMLQAANLAVAAAYADKQALSGSLRVAAPKALSKQVLMPLVFEFMRIHPQVQVHMKVEDHFVDPVSNDVDVVIHITQTPILGLVARSLGPCRMRLCASSRYIEQNGMPQVPSDLNRHACICLGESPKDSVWSFTKHSEKAAVNVSGHLTVNHSEIRREAVLNHLGISLFPDFTIQHHIANGKVVEVLPDWQLGGRYQGDIVAQYVQSRYVPQQIKGFLDFLSDRAPLNRASV
ncbi:MULTISPECIES: LysR family transcriptional regulator [Vibrio]|uniref:LysR family transcriptional regulator n=2 Tax=Vibrio TaxID=662 RepID=A0A7X4LP77_9VIBR|nr:MULTISPECIES: LysR family transcriptional regulator [Vibrio]MBF9000850.1 LysR family transcriptional regulator [Vibrio nitrifigilis]MZI95307.1 LysR family transcriptional regulator [Vibrio eleionomae]